jgi:hypothetical protein
VGGLRLNDKEVLISYMKFNKLFDQAMIRALKFTYETPQFTNEQIIKSWELVRQRLDDKALNIGCED